MMKLINFHNGIVPNPHSTNQNITQKQSATQSNNCHY